ncbi:CPBP family intramembrane glutamic endopeptidase [Pendulispora albinea]|uniref:CPBP family intramembrane metalloprotease n=1 Tax=Pendulispora albinea TaxID=2741071 RepID=A0ABZ2M5C7_9BACT
MRVLFDGAGDATEKYLLGLVYLVLGLLGAGASLALGQSPVTMPPWLPIGPETGIWASLAMGACLAGATIVATRFLVGRFSWARELHGELRPVVRGTRSHALVAIALAGGIAEEMLFRGALLQGLGGLWGLVLSSVAFGALHQVRGGARWVWALWATLMGFLLGSVFGLTGNLAGPIAAHVAINAVNLRFLRDHEV